MPRSRRKTSVLDDLFDLLIELPTWAGPVVIFGVFAAFRWLFPWMVGVFSPGTDVGKISTPIFSQAAIKLAPVAAGLATVVWIVAIFKKPRRE